MTAVAWISPANLHGDEAPPIVAGDLIRTGENFHPHYRVIALSEDRAWIRDVQYGTDHIVPFDRCRKIERPAPRGAAD